MALNLDELEDLFSHFKNERDETTASRLIRSLEDRSLGHLRTNVKYKRLLELYAEEEFIRKENYDELHCEMPGNTKSTFVMAFSTDGTKVASTHGNHHIYVTDLRTGKHIKTLIGHPRTPWCVAFHPTSNQILASGCLGGQVRIWDLSGGSEVWTANNGSVIASIAFHPNDRVLVIATVNELYFWDWSKPEPFCHTATSNVKEKIRYVAFDKSGTKLITGIANSHNRWEYVRSSMPVARQFENPETSHRRRFSNRMTIHSRPCCRQQIEEERERQQNAVRRENALSTVPERERNITICYRNLVREYGRLVQRYLQLYRPPAMVDRGTDPMESGAGPSTTSSNATQTAEASPSTPAPAVPDNTATEPSTSAAEDQTSSSNRNPFQLLTPSRILAVMNKPTTLIRGTQTSDSNRKHKADEDDDATNGSSSKKQKVNKCVANETPLKPNEFARVAAREGSPLPGPSRLSDDGVHVLDDIVNAGPRFDSSKPPKSHKSAAKFPATSQSDTSTSSDNSDNENSNNREAAAANVPLPGTSRDNDNPVGPSTSAEPPDEINRRLDNMMMNIGRNGDDDLRSRVMPLIRSVPENNRLDLLRLFEQGVKESRDKARQRYKHMGQMINRKPSRRPVVVTSSDSTSSDDERYPLHMNFLNQTRSGNGQVGANEAGEGTSQQGLQVNTNRPEINNLENWVTSLFYDADPQTSSNAATSNETNLDAAPPPSTDNPLEESLQRTGNDVTESNSSSMSTNVVENPPLPISLPAEYRPSNTHSYNMANRRRLGVSSLLPTRFYPRAEFRRNRNYMFGRRRSNIRPFRCHNVVNRRPPSPANFSNDEVINFSELPNSEDDPFLGVTFRNRPPRTSSPLVFHPFNPPPDLPAINPENIGIGNMYSNIVQDLEASLNDVRNIRAASRPGEMSNMLSNFSERLENIMNQSETILRNLRTSVEMLPSGESATSGSDGRGTSTPAVSYSDANYYIRDRMERMDGVVGDHTYPRNRDAPAAAPSTSTNDAMSPLMTSLHLTISHIQRQARLLRQQVESIERIDRAMVEVAQLQLMRPLLLELSRYVRNMSGESRSTCMSSVRQMMAGTRISDSSPVPESNDETPNRPSSVSAPAEPQPSTSSAPTPPPPPQNPSSVSMRTRALKTYPPSRLNRLNRNYRRTTFFRHVPRRYALRLPPRSAANLISSASLASSSFGLDHQSMMNMYSRINSFTLSRMNRRLEDLIGDQVRIFTQSQTVRMAPRTTPNHLGERNLAARLRDCITRINRLVGSVFDVNMIRNYRMGNNTTGAGREGADRFYARQTLSFIIDGVSSHLEETRSGQLPQNIRHQVQAVITMSMLLLELLLLQIIDSIPPPTDMNLDRERQSLTNRIDQKCTTIIQNGCQGDFSNNLVYTVRRLQGSILYNGNQPTNSQDQDPERRRPRDIRRAFRLDLMNSIRNVAAIWRMRDQSIDSTATESGTFPVNDSSSTSPRHPLQTTRRRDLNETGDESSDSRTLRNDEEESGGGGGGGGGDTAGYRRIHIFDRLNAFRSTATTDRGEEAATEDVPAQSSSSQMEERRYVPTWPNGGESSSNVQNSHLPPTFRLAYRLRSPGTSWASSNGGEGNSSNNAAGANGSNTGEASNDWTRDLSWAFNVPSVRVNDVPIAELGQPQENQSNATGNSSTNTSNNNNNNNNYPTREMIGRLAAIRSINEFGIFRPRFLHPLYTSVNPFDAELDEVQREHIYDGDVVMTVTPNHRIQVWDMSASEIPSIKNPSCNVVVSECKIHNDASVDIASDGSMLVTLLPSGGYLNITNRLGVYSLKWETLGQCLYTTNFDHNAVSVSLSPLGRHLVVGLASRRVSIVPTERWVLARIFKIDHRDIPADRLPLVKELDQSRDGRATSHKSVNCIKWLPTSGQGLIYATNTGQLVIWT